MYGGSSMGSPLPPLTLANTRVVQLRLTSDAARQGRGFVARYWVVHRAGLLAAPGSGGGGLGAGFAVGSSVTIRGPAVVQDVYAAGASCTSSTSSSSGSEVQLSASAALTFILDASEARDAVGLPFARASWSVLQAPPGPGPAAEAPQHAANEQGGANGGADGGADGGGAAGPWAALAAAVAAANSNATDWWAPCVRRRMACRQPRAHTRCDDGVGWQASTLGWALPPLQQYPGEPRHTSKPVHQSHRSPVVLQCSGADTCADCLLT